MSVYTFGRNCDVINNERIMIINRPPASLLEHCSDQKLINSGLIIIIIFTSHRFIRFVIGALSDLKSTIKTHKHIHNVFTATVSRHPEKTAILFEDRSWTFRELECFANQVGHFFLEQGLKKGDTVAMFMENCPEFVGLWLGLSKIGVKGIVHKLQPS